MASFFSKFARGAATAGAQIIGEQQAQQSKADIVAKRDAVLEANRATREQSRREFVSGESEKARTFKASESAKGRAATLGSPQAKLARLKLSEATTLSDLKKGYIKAKDDEERFGFVKQIMAMAGRPIEGQRITKGTTGVSLLKFVAGELSDEQKAKFIYPGDEGYRGPRDIMAEAEDIIKGKVGIPTGGLPTGGLPSVASKEDFDKLPSGAEYINANTGKKGRKP